MKSTILNIFLAFTITSAQQLSAQSMLEEGNQWTFQEIKWTLVQGLSVFKE